MKNFFTGHLRVVKIKRTFDKFDKNFSGVSLNVKDKLVDQGKLKSRKNNFHPSIGFIIHTDATELG